MGKRKRRRQPRYLPVDGDFASRRLDDNGSRETIRPPDNLWQAILRGVWSVPLLLRIPLIVFLVLSVAVFLIWATLPDSSKEAVIRPLLQPPAQGSATVARTPIQTLVERKEPVAPSQLSARTSVDNGDFDRDLTSWGWTSRFPNGMGRAAWSPFDATNLKASGSLEVRAGFDGAIAYQIGQCVKVEPGAYFYHLQYRAKTREAVRAVVALVQFLEPDCKGGYAPYAAKTLSPTKIDVWESVAYTTEVLPAYQSAMIILAAWPRHEGFHSVWFDNVALTRLRHTTAF